MPAHLASEPPRFDARAVAADLRFPPPALRAAVEGMVVLELFVDETGTVRMARVVSEEPQGRGFGEAARNAFLGRRGTPAMSDGTPVPSRLRYPVNFRLR